jgi:asparagine synthase (glutamine-hydrolysing)
MGNSVEGRLPFLDHRVIEFCAKLPPRMKLKVMKEKYLLKKIAGPYLPEEICKRPKQAYRAPDSASFFKGRYLKYVSDLLSADNVRKTGYFDADMVGMLVNKCKKAEIGSVSARDNMAVVGVVTTLLLHDKFIRR